eukprot:GILI01009445.1.p1 GENE.GILI01009445.1~~GILI01009445.1.p1  ORF type:complete len:132 (+),score=47.11 GILI01009445.1:61-456(+)
MRAVLLFAALLIAAASAEVISQDDSSGLQEELARLRQRVAELEEQNRVYESYYSSFMQVTEESTFHSRAQAQSASSLSSQASSASSAKADPALKAMLFEFPRPRFVRFKPPGSKDVLGMVQRCPPGCVVSA